MRLNQEKGSEYENLGHVTVLSLFPPPYSTKKNTGKSVQCFQFTFKTTTDQVRFAEN